jgi:hypothetical protein
MGKVAIDGFSGNLEKNAGQPSKGIDEINEMLKDFPPEVAPLP